MLDYIKKLLVNENIFYSANIPLSECKIVKSYLLEREGISSGSAVVFLIPYLSPDGIRKDRNISSYAVPCDYHNYIHELSARILPELKREYPNRKFSLFADHSPIDERDAAVKCGLGILGRNGLLITEQYSSYVFIAEIITDADLGKTTIKNDVCEGCGKCISSCPGILSGKSYCLSALTQKKGELSDSERELLRQHPLIWGCDICQEVCPHTIRAMSSGTIFSPVDYFRRELTPSIDEEVLNAMTDSEFVLRAYSWRGRNVILRNLKIKKEDGGQ